VVGSFREQICKNHKVHSINIWTVKIKIAVVRLVKSLVIFILPSCYDFLIFQTIRLLKLTLSNKLQNYLSVFCNKVKLESSKRTRVVLLAREKKLL
jgi:hypothetical protein